MFFPWFVIICGDVFSRFVIWASSHPNFVLLELNECLSP